MRLGALAASLMLVTSPLAARPSPAKADPRDLHHCKLTAVSTVDNDIRLEEDRPRSKPRSAELPEPVARAILDHVSGIAKKQFTAREWNESKQTCDDIFSPVFELTAPAGLQLYVAPRYFVVGNSVDYFLMYNPRTRAVTRSPPLIFTKWWQAFDASDPLKKHPIVRVKAAWHGGPPLLIVEERTHNGNVYDAAVYRYFEIGKDMSLTQILAVEARAILLSERNEYTRRNATFLGSNRVRLDVSSRSSSKFGAWGSVLLERSHVGQPFHVARRIPARKSNGNSRVGCDFYY